jgi:Peptidase family M23/Bacterial Ig-like domain
LRGQAHPGAGHRVHRLAGTVLAIPVIAQVYAGAAADRLRSAAPAVLVAVMLAGSLGAQGLVGSAVTATEPGSPTSLASVELRPVVLPVDPDTPAPVATPLEPRPAATAGPAMPLVGPARARAEIIRFRPRNGQSGITPGAQVSVRFTTAMDVTTRRAFQVVVRGSPVPGRYRWAEGNTVLVFTPAAAFPYGATVTLTVTGDARASDGTSIRRGRSVSFSVAKRPLSTPSPASTTGGKPSTKATPAPRTAASHGWRWPLHGPITQYFGQTLTRYGYHYGIDIDGQTGDPVRAARSGTVTVAGHYDSCSGLQVTIDHGGGIESWYRHLSSIDVRVGAHVTAGTVIGRVGATGCALGSHLHFAIRRNGRFVDPMDYLPPR